MRIVGVGVIRGGGSNECEKVGIGKWAIIKEIN